jgi:hypothetical protein
MCSEFLASIQFSLSKWSFNSYNVIQYKPVPQTYCILESFAIELISYLTKI